MCFSSFLVESACARQPWWPDRQWRWDWPLLGQQPASRLLPAAIAMNSVVFTVALSAESGSSSGWCQPAAPPGFDPIVALRKPLSQHKFLRRPIGCHRRPPLHAH